MNADQVGVLLTDLLETITRHIENQSQVSDGDVLQSLCMALAIRMNMVEVPLSKTQGLVTTLLAQANEAITTSIIQPAGKA